jgi:hypothetical protein
MSASTEPLGLRRTLSSAWLGLAGHHPTPALATPPRARRRSGFGGFGSSVMTPESWHVPGRHEHGRPLLSRTPGGVALAGSWS